MAFGTIYFIKQNGGNNDRWNMKMNVVFVMLFNFKWQSYNENIVAWKVFIICTLCLHSVHCAENIQIIENVFVIHSLVTRYAPENLLQKQPFLLWGIKHEWVKNWYIRLKRTRAAAWSKIVATPQTQHEEEDKGTSYQSRLWMITVSKRGNSRRTSQILFKTLVV